MQRKKIKIGDVFEISLSDGCIAYGQYVFKDQKMGPLVQIFDVITKDKIEITNLKNAKLLFPPVITGVFAAIKSEFWKVVGHLPVENFVYPKFISAHYNEKTWVAHNWFLWDGEKYTRLGSKLPVEYSKLEYLLVWDPRNLVHRIETGENPYDKLKMNK
jgi:hypothetical protein